MSRRTHRKHGALHARRATRAGTVPGTLVADPAAPLPDVTTISFDAQEVVEFRGLDPAALRACVGHRPVTWVNVDGLGDAEVIRGLGEFFELHPLALEDVLNVQQRAKVEVYDRYLFIVVRMPTGVGAETEQLSMFLGPDFVLTFQEGRPGDPFDPVRDHIRKHATMRAHGADYLAYALLDAGIDRYFPLLESLGEQLETLEDEILARPDRHAVARLHDTKRQLLALRRAVWPLREALNSLARDVTPLIADEARLHLRDCYDHAVRIIDFVETYRELGSDLMDLYLSSVSQRLNEVMKVLTIIATIFIPLTFISSIYGMNFDPHASPWNMPELRWYWGYPSALLLMALVGGGLVVYFWRKGWLGSNDAGPHER